MKEAQRGNESTVANNFKTSTLVGLVGEVRMKIRRLITHYKTIDYKNNKNKGNQSPATKLLKGISKLIKSFNPEANYIKIGTYCI